VEGYPLTFHLHGINNQNFLMRDRETGTWWQQVTGEAVVGRLRGRRLQPIEFEEVTFAVWKREHPEGRVMRPEPRHVEDDSYAGSDWEEHVAKVPPPPGSESEEGPPPRQLVMGVELGAESVAYPIDALRTSRAIADTLAGTPIVVVLGDDDRSVRAWKRVVEGQELDLFVASHVSSDVSLAKLLDSQTGSEWDFAGTCIAGPLVGRRLERVPVLPSYWFDWKAHHPETRVHESAVN